METYFLSITPSREFGVVISFVIKDKVNDEFPE